MIRNFLCSTTALTLLAGMISAAPKSEKTTAKSDVAAAQNLADVLRLEQTADQPDRAAVLRALQDAYPTHAATRWASGQVSSAGSWQDFSAALDASTADDRLLEYRELRAASQLTPERHQELASWCHNQGLIEQERAHLWQTLLVNPAQPEIWRKLGYQQVNGQWLSEDDVAAFEQAQRTYQQNLQRWRKQAQSISQRLASPQPSARDSARESLRAIEDESAVPALEIALAYTSAEQGREFVGWVQQRSSLSATFALTRLSILSPWDDVREMAIDGLRLRRWEHFVPTLLEMLSDQQATEIVVHAPSRMRMGSPVLTAIFRREFRHFVEVRQHTVVAGAPLPGSSTIVLNRRRPNFVLFRVGILAETRAAIDNDLRLSELASNLESSVADDTASVQIQSTLQAVTGEAALQNAGDWWTWWGSLTATPVQDSSSKGVVEVAETSTFRPFVANMVLRGSCLPAGSLIYTELGHRPVESIQVGDRVLAKNVETGELAFSVVKETTVRRPQPLVKLSMSRETIEATRGHHFWVSGRGWRMAREIQPGDRLHGVHGTVRITDVSTGEMADVYNLVVDRASTYFVGKSLVLSHDVTFPVPTDVKVPGLAAR